MRAFAVVVPFALWLASAVASISFSTQNPLLDNQYNIDENVSVGLFAELEELARIVDISYCVGFAAGGISKPFRCLSRCSSFPGFELVTRWNTGPLLSDSSGYMALDHLKQRTIVAFRGTYSIANTIVDLSTIPQAYVPFPGSDDDDAPRCSNCSVHTGFQTSWSNTRDHIMPDLENTIASYPDYELNLVGHSLGGAVATLAGLDARARGWNPVVTTFGQPRVGNIGFVRYLDARFDLLASTTNEDAPVRRRFRRVTHVDDPVPLLPLSEWGYVTHAGEIYISKKNLSPDIGDVRHCKGDHDRRCIAGQDSTTPDDDRDDNYAQRHASFPDSVGGPHRRDLIASVEDEIRDVMNEPWGIPSRYKLWQLLSAHRDYFWRLGLCIPDGSPMDGQK